jgi:hypothetical protein
VSSTSARIETALTSSKVEDTAFRLYAGLFDSEWLTAQMASGLGSEEKPVRLPDVTASSFALFVQWLAAE